MTDLELQVFVLDRFDIEADGGDGRDDLSDLHPVQDGRLSPVFRAARVFSLQGLVRGSKG